MGSSHASPQAQSLHSIVAMAHGGAHAHPTLQKCGCVTVLLARLDSQFHKLIMRYLGDEKIRHIAVDSEADVSIRYSSFKFLFSGAIASPTVRII